MSDKLYLVGGKPSKHFSWEEICNNLTKNPMKFLDSPEARRHLRMMDDFRDYMATYIPVPFATEGLVPTSWYRDEDFNREIGGAPNSAHLPACASDIKNIDTGNEILVTKAITAWQVICMKYGVVGGIEIYPRGYQGSKRGLMHFDSVSDRFGTKVFRLKDNR